MTIDLPAASSDAPRSRSEATSRTWVSLLASAVLMFAAVALAAVIIPALRASRVEPVSALRAE